MTKPEPTEALLPHRRATIAIAVLWLGFAAAEFAMHRPPICPCGTVRLWWGVVQSSENSQHVADWYSFSHLIHGFLAYGAAWLLWHRWRLLGGRPARWSLPIALAFEGAWELLENSPIVIDRYRAVTVSWGYSGDSILNSMSDIGFMAAGFAIAARLPWWATVLLGLGFEAMTAIVIRDGLALNVLMLVWPLDAVRHWQAGA